MCGAPHSFITQGSKKARGVVKNYAQPVATVPYCCTYTIGTYPMSVFNGRNHKALVQGFQTVNCSAKQLMEGRIS